MQWQVGEGIAEVGRGGKFLNAQESRYGGQSCPHALGPVADILDPERLLISPLSVGMEPWTREPRHRM